MLSNTRNKNETRPRLEFLPSGWPPQGLDVPVFFQSEILIDGRSGRFCRPAFMEAIRDLPRLHAVLAHLRIPWRDEANTEARMVEGQDA